MEELTNGSTRSLQYYAITVAWIDELKYFKAEASYLCSEFDDFGINFPSSYYEYKIKRMKMNLLRLERDRERIHRMLNHQLERLNLSIDDKANENMDILKFSQVRLEYIMKDFCRVYKALKMNFFELVELVNNEEIPVFYRAELNMGS